MRKRNWSIDPRAWLALTACTTPAFAAGAAGETPRAVAEELAAETQQPAGFAARQGWTLELHGTWAQLGGDFDGDTGLMGATDTIFVPDADDGTGFGLAVGRRWDRYALELAFTHTQHDGSIPPPATGGDVSYDVLELNGRYFFRTGKRLQPFLLGGLGFALATLEDASTDGANVGDADLSGLQLSLGAGLEHYLSDRWSLGLRACYRYAFFDTAEGVAGDEGSIDESVDGGGLALTFGTTFTL